MCEVSLTYADGAKEYVDLRQEVLDLRSFAPEVTALLGKRIEVLFEHPPRYFSATVTNYSPKHRKHYVSFDDNDGSGLFDLISHRAIQFKQF